MDRRIKRHLITLLVVGSLSALASSAAASSPPTVVDGYLSFYMNQGNFCPNGRDCTGARYHQPAYQILQPVRDMKFRVIRLSTGEVIGQGVTSNSGFFTANLAQPGSEPFGVSIVFTFEHGGGRFSVVDADGDEITVSIIGVAQPRQVTFVGGFALGSAAAPHAIANLYDGGIMMWNFSLGNVALMHAHYNDLEVRAFDNSNCPTSCANGPQNRVTIDSTGSAYRPQARMMHEMGHIASYRASQGQSFSCSPNYNWPSQATNGGTWTSTTGEWGKSQFEEGLATHLADIALYTSDATTPTTCNSTVACPDNANTNLETSLGTSCTAAVTRAPLQAMRYLWDLYDTSNDYSGETLSGAPFRVLETINDFANGTGNNQKNECQVDLDGRGMIDYSAVFVFNNAAQLNNNCGGVGD